MSLLCRCAAILAAVLISAALQAEVIVHDSGASKGTIGQGAPAHTVGLERLSQVISLDTGKMTYGLRYVIALDEKRPGVGIPGEGYLGMPLPVDCNWYGAGFFDLQLNGQSIGSTLLHSLTGRSSGDRGAADFVFDHPLALIRLRFVALTGGDCLYTQLLLEPKQPITSVRVSTRCYPSAYVSASDRRVLTAVREIPQGQHVELDVAREWWNLYYDTQCDAGQVVSNQNGVGPCALLWLPSQTEKVGFSVGHYGTETPLDLKPSLREFRFVFFDYAGRKNAEAKADLQGRAQTLVEQLATFPFTDPSLTNWSLADKQAEVQRALGTLPPDSEAAVRYQRWAAELGPQLEALRTGQAGTILTEANVARTIGEWERGLPELRLKALLNRI